VVQQARGLFGGAEALGPQQDALQFAVWVGDSGRVVSLSQRFQTVFVSGDDSLYTAQWNFVVGCLPRFAAKVEFVEAS
jgi:hypothetical protein